MILKTETVNGTNPADGETPILIRQTSGQPIGADRQGLTVDARLDCPKCGAGISIRVEKRGPAATWSHDPPKASGFYWYRDDGFEPQIISFYVDESGASMWFPTGCESVDPRDFHGQYWSEPLTPPGTP